MVKRKTFKFAGSTVMYYPELAKIFGSDKEWLFFSHICYKIINHNNYKNGRYWYYGTDEELHDFFCNWSLKTVKRVKKAVIGKRFLIADELNKMSRDRTTWYAINYELLSELGIELEDEKEVKDFKETVEPHIGSAMTYEQAQRMYDA